jgi:acetyltransferase-like isoleucine patch superfamily enzyme
MIKLNKAAYLASVIKRDPFELLRLLAMGLNTAKYRYLLRCVGQGTIVGRHTEIINASRVKIGKGCLLQDSVYIRAGTQGEIIMGDRAGLNSFCRVFGHGSVMIGEDAQIGPGTLITTTTHSYYDDLETSFKPVVIGKGVWIGGNSTILPGVTIGDFSVVGAGSVVTRDVPPGAVVVGVPARVIKWINEEPRDLKEVNNLTSTASNHL